MRTKDDAVNARIDRQRVDLSEHRIQKVIAQTDLLAVVEGVTLCKVLLCLL